MPLFHFNTSLIILEKVDFHLKEIRDEWFYDL